MMDFYIELQETNKLLSRIANALERAVGPDPTEITYRKREASELVQYGQRTWMTEQLMPEIISMGLPQSTQDQILSAALDEMEKGEPGEIPL